MTLGRLPFALALTVLAAGCAPLTRAVRAAPSPAVDVALVQTMLLVPSGELPHRRARAEAVVQAHALLEAFAREHGWEAEARRRPYDGVELFDTQAALFRRVLELNHLPPDTALPTTGLMAGIEGRVLVALTPRAAAALVPDYASAPDSWVRLLAHELAHRLQVEVLRGDEEAMGPQWFYEGFATVAAGQVLGEPLRYATADEALAGAHDTRSPLAYRRYQAALRFFLEHHRLDELVRRAKAPDFERWLATP